MNEQIHIHTYIHTYIHTHTYAYEIRVTKRRKLLYTTSYLCTDIFVHTYYIHTHTYIHIHT